MAVHAGAIILRDIRPEKILVALDGVKLSACANAIDVRLEDMEVRAHHPPFPRVPHVRACAGRRLVWP
jgi:hypothetical protein